MRRIFYFPALIVLLLVGCSTAGGPRPPKSTMPTDIPQKDINSISACEERYPDQDGVFDPLNGYFMWVGPDSENVRQCLKAEHGWFELSPPEWAQGTMAPPR